MATGDTAKPLALSSSPPPFLEQSPSNLSSPLSEVEVDKDHEGDLDLGLHVISNSHDLAARLQQNGSHVRAPSPTSDSDDISKLSEVDVNDSDAETERLQSTPNKKNVARDVANGAAHAGSQQFVLRRDQNFEHSPSKLKEFIHEDPPVADAVSNNDSLSEPGDLEEILSPPRSEPDARATDGRASRSTNSSKGVPGVSTTRTASFFPDQRIASTESRKRKRSPLAEQSESEQPLRRRTGLVTAPERCPPADDDCAVIDDDDDAPLQLKSKTSARSAQASTKGESTRTKERSDKEHPDPPRAKRSLRLHAKNRKSKSPDQNNSDHENDDKCKEPGTCTGKDFESTLSETGPGDDNGQGCVDADEETEAHQREEELVERKRAACEELAEIEKQFSCFRERLYQEKLVQLNHEEALLTADNPTHPEYLAMLRCIDESRDEKIKIASLELDMKLEVLLRRAVAERAQIMSQFFQSVRASREEKLENLGQRWYDIQHERRHFSNNIPDYGIRFPGNKVEAIKHAVAYNKEVSILSGFAKHVGFPSAPSIHGASEDQIENDLEAIHRARHTKHDSMAGALSVPHHDAPASLMRTVLDPAGEQFIEHTSWTNPNHPLHHVHRQHILQEVNGGGTIAAPANRRLPHQHQHLPTSGFAPLLNGNSITHMQVSYSATGHDPPARPARIHDSAMKREATQAF